MTSYCLLTAQTEGDTGDSYLDAYDYDDPDIEPGAVFSMNM